MENSTIPWCYHTFNPWEGCTMCSPGCFNCYALARNKRFSGGVNWGKGAPRRHTSDDNWKKPEEWNRRAEMVNRVYAEAGDTAPPIRPRVFCASLADWLDDEVPIEWLADLLDLIRRTPNLDWLLLTKRPQNWRERVWAAAIRVRDHHGANQPWLNFISEWVQHGNAPANVWIGTTVEDQARADERIPILLSIPAKVRFLSCEPLLESLNLCSRSEQRGEHYKTITGTDWLGPDEPKIHWVIGGCESGKGKRAMQTDWVLFLAAQCKLTDTAFFMKQMVVNGAVSETLTNFPADLQIRQFPETCQRLSNT